MNEKEITKFVEKLEGYDEERVVERDGQRERRLRVFRREGKIFLVILKGSDPLRIEVRCDGKLGKLLRGQYESVMLSRSLGGNGVEVICSGQLARDEIFDLVRHSYISAGLAG